MKRGSTLFLKAVIILIATGVMVGLVWFPQTEGRAAHLDLVHIYSDPFIMYIYIASIPFFLALFQGIRLLGFIDKNNIFSSVAVKAVETIKYSASALVLFMAAATAYIVITTKMTPHSADDPAGFLMLGAVVIFAAAVIATAAAVLQKLLQNVVDMKTENDLTV